MTPSRHRDRGPRPDWTGADYESLEVLQLLGVRNAVAQVNRARAPRPVRRAVRAALRTARHRLRTLYTHLPHTA